MELAGVGQLKHGHHCSVVSHLLDGRSRDGAEGISNPLGLMGRGVLLASVAGRRKEEERDS